MMSHCLRRTAGMKATITLVTGSNSLESFRPLTISPDERLLAQSLQWSGCRVHCVAWNDPTIVWDELIARVELIVVNTCGRTLANRAAFLTCGDGLSVQTRIWRT